MSEVSTVPSPNSGNSSRGISRGSGRVTFPQSAKSMSSTKSAIAIIENAADTNPFKVPPDQDIFMLRDKERQRKKEERDQQRSLRVHEKTTYASRVNAKTAAMRKAVLGDDESMEDAMKALAVKDDPGWTLAVTRDRNVEKEDLADYVAKKRQMFLVQYSLAVKRDEMRKLEELASAEERKLERAEKFLEEDAAMFDEFLKENDRNSVEAIKMAEGETKSKLEKVAEIKKNTAMMMAIRSEISKHEETLKEYMLYKEFLMKLTPHEWKEERRLKHLAKKKSKAKEPAVIHHPSPMERRSAMSSAKKRVDTESRGSSRGQSRDSAHHHKRSALRGSASGHSRRTLSTPKSATDSESVRSAEVTFSEDESDSEPELFFSDPRQLLSIFQELEEQNLSLITNSQETEEAMEELKQHIQLTKAKLGRETDTLKSQINILKATIKREEEKADDLELKSRMFSYGEFKAEDQEKMLKQLHRKVEEVFRACIGENEANISTLQMLTTIENKLEELFENIEVMPPELVEAAEKAKEKERRMRLREEKLAAQRAHQEERVRKALERAKADPKKKGGKRLVFRSEPPQRKQKESKKKDARDKEEEELQYYFT